MRLRMLSWALAGAVTLVPVAAMPQELALTVAPALVIPAAPPALSPDCRTRLTVGDRFRRPLRSLRRAVRGKRSVRVLAIGSSSTVGVGAS
jgi:acyl-CoA thioesterase I